MAAAGAVPFAAVPTATAPAEVSSDCRIIVTMRSRQANNAGAAFMVHPRFIPLTVVAE